MAGKRSVVSMDFISLFCGHCLWKTSFFCGPSTYIFGFKKPSLYGGIVVTKNLFGMSHLWSQYKRIFGRHLQLKTTTLLVLFLWLINSLKNLYIICLLITLRNLAFFYLQYGFRSTHSTAHLLTVLSDRIVRAFNRSEATQAVAIDISKNFDRAWHTGLI